MLGIFRRIVAFTLLAGALAGAFALHSAFAACHLGCDVLAHYHWCAADFCTHYRSAPATATQYYSNNAVNEFYTTPVAGQYWSRMDQTALCATSGQWGEANTNGTDAGLPTNFTPFTKCSPTQP